MPIVSDDLITLKQAENVKTASGDMLSRRQIHHLCTQGRLEAQKIGTIWLVSRKSIEAYKPNETGFALVWKNRRSKQAKLVAEKAAILAQAKGTKEELK
jgi:hypothetical protein